MAKEKKTDLEAVVKKAKSEPVKNPVPPLEVRVTKPIIKPKNKRKKPKEKTDNGKKKARGKTVKKPGTNDKGNKGRKPGKGDKTPVQRTPVKRERVGILDRILPPWF